MPLNGQLSATENPATLRRGSESEPGSLSATYH
jgi:hypothetical protein